MPNLTDIVCVWKHLIEYQAYGFVIFPANPKTKSPCKFCLESNNFWVGGRDGWTLITLQESEEEWDKLYLSRDKIKQKYIGISILTGEKSGLFVMDVDIDGMDAYNRIFKDIVEKEGYPVVSTPSGGLHVYFLYKSYLKKFRSSTKKFGGIDFRSNGAQVLAPPTLRNFGIHKGKRYQWINNKGFIEMSFNIYSLLCEEFKFPISEDEYNGKDIIKISDSFKLREHEYSGDEENLLSEILSVLSKERYTKRDDWLRVIFVISDVFKKSEEGLEYAREWSSLWDCWEEDPIKHEKSVEDAYSRDQDVEDRVKIGTLIKWAKEDCPEWEIPKIDDYIDFDECWKDKNYGIDEFIMEYCIEPKSLSSFDEKKELLRKMASSVRYICSGENSEVIIKHTHDRNDMIKYERIPESTFRSLYPAPTRYTVGRYYVDIEIVQKELGTQVSHVEEKTNRWVFEKLFICEKFVVQICEFVPYSPLEEDPLPNMYPKRKCINTFQEFKAKLLEEYNQNKFHHILNDLIFKTFAKGNEEYYRYIISWLADFVQNPRKRDHKTMLIIISLLEGTGKTLFINFFVRKVIGLHLCIELETFDELLEDFNDQYDNCILILISELDSIEGKSDSHKKYNKMKNKINGNTVTFNGKYKTRRVNVPIYWSFIGTSNNPACCFISSTTRRMSAFRASDENAKNNIFFEPIIKETNTDDCGDHFYSWLMRLDVSNFNAENIPNTDAMVTMINASQSIPETFASELFDEEISLLQYEKIDINGHKKLIRGEILEEKGSKYISSDYMWGYYLGWCENKKYKPGTMKMFPINLMKAKGWDNGKSRMFFGFGEERKKKSVFKLSPLAFSEGKIPSE